VDFLLHAQPATGDIVGKLGVVAIRLPPSSIEYNRPSNVKGTAVRRNLMVGFLHGGKSKCFFCLQ